MALLLHKKKSKKRKMSLKPTRDIRQMIEIDWLHCLSCVSRFPERFLFSQGISIHKLMILKYFTIINLHEQSIAKDFLALKIADLKLRNSLKFLPMKVSATEVHYI